MEKDQPYPHGQSAPRAAPAAMPLPPPATQNRLSRAHAAHPPNHPYPEWLSLIMSFCFAGISMALQSIQASNHVPLSYHMAGLGMVFALAAFVVSKYIPTTYLRREAQFLDNAGVFFGVTAFFLDITLSLPLCLKVISWTIYVAALLAIILFRVWLFNTDRIESQLLSPHHDLPPVLPLVQPRSPTCDPRIGLELVKEAQPYPHGQCSQQAPEAETSIGTPHPTESQLQCPYHDLRPGSTTTCRRL